MISLKQLIVRIVLLVVAFTLLGFASIFGTTLAFQGHIHPDYWSTTKYDIAGLSICLLCFLISIGVQVNQYVNQADNEQRH